MKKPDWMTDEQWRLMRTQRRMNVAATIISLMAIAVAVARLLLE